MDYSKDIIEILAKVPQGLSIRKIVRHVYNAHNSLFETVDLEEVKRYVTMYLTTRSKTLTSPIEKAEERGVYRLKMSYIKSMELQFQFRDDDTNVEQTKSVVESIDTPLDMFDGMYGDEY